MLKKMWNLMSMQSLRPEAWDLTAGGLVTASMNEGNMQGCATLIVDCSFEADPKNYMNSGERQGVAWPDAKKITELMAKCKPTQTFTDSMKNKFQVCWHSHRETPDDEKESEAAASCTIKGVSFVKVGKNEEMTDSTKLIMGMCVCCGEERSDLNDAMMHMHMKKKRDCVVGVTLQSNANDEFSPLIMVFNSFAASEGSDGGKMYMLAEGSEEGSKATRKPGEVLPLWHMKMYKTATKDRKIQPRPEEQEGKEKKTTNEGGGSDMQHNGDHDDQGTAFIAGEANHDQNKQPKMKQYKWRFLGSIGIANVTAYVVDLPDGSLDLVLARSRVIPSNVDHSPMAMDSLITSQQNALMKQRDAIGMLGTAMGAGFGGGDEEEEEEEGEDGEDSDDSDGDGNEGHRGGHVCDMDAPMDYMSHATYGPTAGRFSHKQQQQQQMHMHSGGGGVFGNPFGSSSSSSSTATSRRFSWFRPSSVKGD